MKRIFLCLLSALLLTSCGGGSGETTSVATADTTPADTAPAETETSVDDLFLIAKEDNGGKSFSLLTTETQQYEFDAEELTGDVVNDAVYGRNMAVEELLGVDMNYIYKPGDWANKDSFCKLITGSIMAADGAYDVVSGMISCVQPIVTSDMFISVYDLEHIDMDNPWWVSELQNNLTIGGKLIGFIGDMSLSMYKGLSVMFANTDLLEIAGMESPYDLVRDGAWTLDKMIEVTTGVSQDANGDGTLKLGEDVMGIAVHEVAYRSIQASLDIEAISIGDDGVPMVNPISDKMSTAADKLAAWFDAEDVAIAELNNDYNQQISDAFASNGLYYLLAKLENLDMLRDMESDYAVLPFPKYDENQEKHLSLIATATQMTYIPTTTNDSVLTGKVCEALSFYSYKDVVPAYYDVALKNKYSRDENTRDMLEIIRAGAVLPFEYAYSTMIAGEPWPNKLLSDCSFRYPGQLASKLAAVTKTWQSGIEKAMEAYTD